MITKQLSYLDIIKLKIKLTKSKTRIIYIYKRLFFFKKSITLDGKEKDIEIKHLRVLLEKSKIEKELLLKEVHHRIKNNLQLIMSLCNIESRKNKLSNFNNFFQKSQLRIESIALIHQSLYQSENFEKIDTQKYIEQLIINIIKIYDLNTEKINCNINTNNIFLNIHTTTSLGLIITEIITNTFKHAFPDNYNNAVIKIELSQNNDGQFVLCIHDNGIGFDLKDYQDEHFGIKLVKILVKQMTGNIKFENIDGTRCTILFKENFNL